MIRPTDNIQHLTVRIRAVTSSGSISTGTGFIYSRQLGHERFALLLVTNRHVLSGCSDATFVISTSDTGEKINWGEQVSITVRDVYKKVKFHKNPEIDLAAIDFAWIIEGLRKCGKEPFVKAVNDSLFLSSENQSLLGSVERILMIGYPNGLWDSKNNLPLIRSGILATPANRDWNGKPEFVIDCACFPGSSGSPVFLHQSGSIPTDDGNSITFGERILFLGVLYAGPQICLDGKIEVVEIPTVAVPTISTNVMMNLGYCINAATVKAFLDSFDFQ